MALSVNFLQLNTHVIIVHITIDINLPVYLEVNYKVNWRVYDLKVIR